MKKLTILFAVLLLVSCASSVPMAPATADAAAKASSPAAGTGRIFVIRKAQGYGKAILFHAEVDGKSIGGLAPATYRILDLPPGPHVVRVFGNENEETRSVDVVSGGSKYVIVHVRTGFASARVGLDPETADGPAFLREAALAQ